MIENMLWDGVEMPTHGQVAFLHQGNTSDERVSWWLEPVLFGAEYLLVVSHAPSGREPLRVPAGQWLSFDGTRFGLGRRKGGKDL